MLLVDLCAHGASLETDGEDSLNAAATDIVQLCAAQSLPVTALVGHSFGGKVALRASTDIATLQQV